MCSLDDHKMTTGGLAGGSVVKNCRRCGFGPWVRKIPQRRKWQPLPVFLPGKSHGQRSYSPWGHKESDTTEAHKQQNDSCSSKNSQDLHIEGKKNLWTVYSRPLLGHGVSLNELYNPSGLQFLYFISWDYNTYLLSLSFKAVIMVMRLCKLKFFCKSMT